MINVLLIFNKSVIFITMESSLYNN